MDSDVVEFLTTTQGRALIDSVGHYDDGTALQQGQALRRSGLSPHVAAAVLTQAKLIAKAHLKCGEFARGMLFTATGLEQATRMSVAAHHARRYRDAKVSHVADLTAGIGVDAMALAALGVNVTAIEVDHATAIIADFNLRHWDHARVVHGDAMKIISGLDADAIFADPARRDGSGRTHRPGDYQPPLDDVLALRQRFPTIGIKVGPGIAHSTLPSDAEAQWVSVDGAVVEAGIWCGALASSVGHSALVVTDGSSYEVSGTTERAPIGGVAEYLYEPDGAIIRAGLIGVIAAEVGAHGVDPTIAYLTSSAAIHHPALRGYRIVDHFPYSMKRLKEALRTRDVGSVEIKKRGIDLTPERLRPQLALKGDNSITVIITRVAGRHTALLAYPLESA